MVESTTETLPSADITEPKAPSNTEKDKKKVRQIKQMLDNLSLKLTLHLTKQINLKATLILMYRINHQHLNQKQKDKGLRLRIVKRLTWQHQDKKR